MGYLQDYNKGRDKNKEITQPSSSVGYLQQYNAQPKSTPKPTEVSKSKPVQVPVNTTLIQKARDFVSSSINTVTNLFKKDNPQAQVFSTHEETVRQKEITIGQIPTVNSLYSTATNKNLLKLLDDKYKKLELENQKPLPNIKKQEQWKKEIVEITSAVNTNSKDPMVSLQKELINDKYSRQRGVSNILKVPTASFVSSMFGAVTGIADINTEMEKKAREKLGDRVVNIINPIIGRSSTSLLVPAIKKIEKPFQEVLDKYIEDESPTNPDFGDTLVQGAGSMAVFYAASVLTGGANNIPTALESLSEAGSVYTAIKKRGKFLQKHLN